MPALRIYLSNSDGLINCNFKFVADDYDVAISEKLISNFKAKNTPIEYWVALEKNSTFGG